MEEILWFVSRAAGLVSLLMLTGTVVLGCAHATRASTGGWQRFTLHALHRNLSLLALVFLMVHIGSAILDGYVPLQWVDAVVPFISDYHPVWLGLGAIAFDLLLAVLVTSLLRHRLSQRLWRTVHVASYAMWPVAMLHGLRRRRCRVRDPPPPRAPPGHESPTCCSREPMTALDSHLDAAIATAVFPPSFPGFDGMVDTGPIPIVSPTAVESQRLFAAAPQEWVTADLDAHLARFGPLPLADYPSGAGKRLLVEKVARAGLRGRGGAGYPMAEKMALAYEHRKHAIVLANGCEGDPSSAKDRALLRRAPHLVLDGIALAAHAIGAREAVIALHTGSPLTAVLANALAERVGDPVEVELAEMPAGFVASESTALVNTLNTGDPRPTGVRTSTKGVRGRPTLVSNVETLAHLALIARFGDDWYRAAGTPDSPGTTLVTVSGAVNRPGVHEVELGLPMSDVLELAGGETEPLRAVLIGGLGGSWLPFADAVELPLAHETCADVGIELGVAALVALPQRACGIAETAAVLRFLAEAGAGQCGPCLFGLPAITADFDALAMGAADRDLLPRLHRRLGVIPGRGACSHPDGAVRLAASALHTFADDVAAHAMGRPCPATVLGPWTPLEHHA